jgi:hypothetical protein
MIIQGKEKFKRGLSSMSDATIERAYAARLAFKKCILACISVTQAEIDALEKQRDFIQSLDDDIHCDLTMVDNELASVKETMDERGIVDDISYHHAVYADELVALTVADMQLHQLTSNRSLSIRVQEPLCSLVSDLEESSSLDGDSASSAEDDDEE